MLELLVNIFIFAAAFFVLIKAADYFVEASVSIGERFGMSRLMIGLTIVAIGTSLPEVTTSLGSFFLAKDFSDFIIGTTMGSNITNILLAFGLFLIVAKRFETTKRELFNVFSLIFMTVIFSAFVLLGFINYLAIFLFLYYIFYLYYISKHQEKKLVSSENTIIDTIRYSWLKSSLILVFSLVGLLFGAKLVIFSIENLGRILSIPTAYLTLTTISIATSLPEIAVTISSARKKQYMIGIGNILGTNIMNIGIIIGLSGFYGTFLINSHLYIISTIIFLVSNLIFSYIIIRRKFTYHYGYFFLLIYIFYLSSFFF